MKSPIGLVLVLLMAFAGCSNGRNAGISSAPQADKDSNSRAQLVTADGKSTSNYADSVAKTVPAAGRSAEFEQVSLNAADTASSSSEAADRKIIRNANLTLEVNSTINSQQRVTAIAEAHGGFVVTSEAKQREDTDPAKRTLDIKLVVRVPAEGFGSVLEQIRGLATTLREENVTGQDVTEEFIDLEARIRTQRALELQFLDIMKQARKVEDALEVQRQIADVRTDIEKLEGRKRFLENRASLSTIAVTLEGPKAIVPVTTTGFGRNLREAVAEGVDLGSAIILFLVRFVIIMLPVTLFVLLPLGLLFRYFVRRAKRIQLAEALSTPSGN